MDGRQTGKDFLTRLRSGAMRPSFIRIGMAKAGHGDTDSIMFSESETCERWVAVPLDIVQSVEVIGWTACHDHRHPIVKLQLHEPAPDNKMARMLIDLLTANDGASDRGNGTDGAQGFQRGLTRAPQPRIARACAAASRTASRGLHFFPARHSPAAFAAVAGNVVSNKAD